MLRPKFLPQKRAIRKRNCYDCRWHGAIIIMAWAVVWATGFIMIEVCHKL
jgi:hypothetical protein